jgi:hypothetical protein
VPWTLKLYIKSYWIIPVPLTPDYFQQDFLRKCGWLSCFCHMVASLCLPSQVFLLFCCHEASKTCSKSYSWFIHRNSRLSTHLSLWHMHFVALLGSLFSIISTWTVYCFCIYRIKKNWHTISPQCNSQVKTRKWMCYTSCPEVFGIRDACRHPTE